MNSKELSKGIRATPRSQQISLTLTCHYECGKKPSAPPGMRSKLIRTPPMACAHCLAVLSVEAEKARELLEERLRELPTDISSMTQLSWVHLALKRNSDATKLARQAASLLPPEKDVVVGNLLLTGLAEMEARTGAKADAIAILRRLLSIPAGGSVAIARLKIDPVWDPIRNDPGFQQLLAGKEHVGP